MNYNKNFNKIGFLRKSDQKVHIGRNIWIDEGVYNGVLNKANNKPSLCVDRILIAVFGETVLMTSTKSGKPSNRTLKNKNSDEKKNEIKQLDQTKLQACQDFYNYWLKNVWLAPEDGDIFEEMRLFDKYVSAKTAYYKKQGEKGDITPKSKDPAKKKKTKKQKKDKDDSIQKVDAEVELNAKKLVNTEAEEGRKMQEATKDKENQFENSEVNRSLREEEKITDEDKERPSTSYDVGKFAFIAAQPDEDDSSDGSTIHLSEMESASDPLRDAD
ncbi:uncharacterized protein LOC116417903 [Nasonia vitripennis]|uniref:Uncharacterized protein n=1 Tax=Nasonia vitripennis TaxID=7425 RepID=A0A7M7QLV7_NASVI|nr:uncharacterized protein LOC116417903 [Nasonia vitripennis]